MTRDRGEIRRDRTKSETEPSELRTFTTRPPAPLLCRSVLCSLGLSSFTHYSPYSRVAERAVGEWSVSGRKVDRILMTEGDQSLR